MTLNGSFGARLRARKLYRNSPDRLLVVPLDHSVTDGPIASAAGLNHMVGLLRRQRGRRGRAAQGHPAAGSTPSPSPGPR